MPAAVQHASSLNAHTSWNILTPNADEPQLVAFDIQWMKGKNIIRKEEKRLGNAAPGDTSKVSDGQDEFPSSQVQRSSGCQHILYIYSQRILIYIIRGNEP